MSNLRDEFKVIVEPWLEFLPGGAEAWFEWLVVAWIGVFAVFLHIVLHLFVRHYVANWISLWTSKLKGNWQFSLFSHNLFRRASFVIQGAVVQLQSVWWLDEGSTIFKVIKFASDQWILLFLLLTLFSVLDVFHGVWNRRASGGNHFPIKGILQTIKLLASLFIGLVAIALLIGKSPLLLLSGLGALSAVMMLVFKDPILGLVAGIQLSANDMLAVGDWLEMPKYGADGDVIDIALTTVKVRNWDKTITTIPAYALISDSFKNWRGMTESGGRRISRSVLIETSSIRFLDEALLADLNKSELVGRYLSERLEQIEAENKEKNVDMAVLVNGRRLTNIGTFRQYLVNYLQNHPCIHKDMTLMVRQLAPTSEGLPIQIYAFTNTTSWGEYENIQADIFDHIFAALPAFDLRIHESPTGNDIRSLKDSLKS
ncbi:mechanosensitive ion channel [Reinekea marina]|uniref:Mechanosensitive ion channel family protein n=1 Tax=Reinekea marina TaxID=1310421 RepID=A0ABV7WUB9_9GAMM|nr:mechanosensitive ion channel domain-containing protein [Reinekea marina]MDN3650207.1 mechanosensitive ion channel [Reinekea marina]